MLPIDLKAEQFAGYPPEAKVLAVGHLPALRLLPLSFLPSLLRELIEYDFKFPAERAAIDHELATLSSLTPAQIREWFAAFSALTVSQTLSSFDWINQPAQFVEQLSAYLWTTHQLDGFREAAVAYGDRLQRLAAVEALATPRLGIAVIGEGVGFYDGPLFANLRSHGTCFKQIRPDDGFKLLLGAVEARAKNHPVPYGHWYVDGGQAADHSPLVSSVAFQELEPMRAALLRKIQKETGRPGMGPEELRTYMARLSPADLGMSRGKDEVMQRFQIKLLTEGSGTQIFSTTFVQWTSREVLRRAQAHTLLVRYAPRQLARPMNEMISGNNDARDVDVLGSLIDADMGAYYQWLNQRRLPGAERSSFLVWFEGHREALMIAPSLPQGAESNSVLGLDELLSLGVG